MEFCLSPCKNITTYMSLNVLVKCNRFHAHVGLRRAISRGRHIDRCPTRCLLINVAVSDEVSTVKMDQRSCYVSAPS